jgi:hypothetical protein
MKKTLVFLAILAACGASIAGGQYDGGHGSTPTTTPSGTTNNGGGGGGGGAGVGVGIAAAAAFGAGGSGGSGGNGFGGTGMGGLGGTGGSVGNLTAGGADFSGARIGGDTKVQRSAPPVYAPQATAGGLRTCPKPGVSVGGSGTGGGGLLSFSFGSDTTCRVEQVLGIMDMDPASYSADDRLTVACKQEDIAETDACQRLAKRKTEAARATAVLEGRPAPVASSQTGRALPAEYGG